MNVQENIEDEKSIEEYYEKFGGESLEFLSAYIFANFLHLNVCEQSLSSLKNRSK